MIDYSPLNINFTTKLIGRQFIFVENLEIGIKHRLIWDEY